MGFDPECILQPELVPGEYYCPLCRQLVHPSEVQQTHCGHLFCRPCVQYIIATTRCCPYENHPISEGDPKNLQETNPAVFDAIGRIGVRCLFYKSGCVWQGLLSESATHSSGCAYGNSPVYCNRCGVQILHKQVQEHAQTCNMVQSQPQAQSQSQIQAQQSQAQPQVATQVQAQVQPHTHAQSQSQAQGQPAAQTPTSVQHQPQAQAQPQSQAYAYPTTDQWYQQQYQQYQQQYQQYEQYQQQYQQYEQYQQQQQQQQQQHAPLSNGQPYPVQQPTTAMHQQSHYPPPQMQAAQLHPPTTHLQHPYPQQAQAHPQHAPPQQLSGQPQQYPSQPHPQSHVPPQQQVPPYQQPQPHSHPPHPGAPQSHPQNPYQTQPQNPQMQIPPQQAYQGVPQQHIPGSHSQQPSPWEHQAQPGSTGWVPDGNRQAVQDPNSLPQYPNQHPAQNVPYWQGKNLPGQNVHPTAPHPQPHAMQPWANAHMQPINQPARPSAFNAPTSQSFMHAQQTQKPAQNLNGLPRAQTDKITQAANQHASITPLDNKTNHVTAVDGAKSATEAVDSELKKKMDNQLDDKVPATDNSAVENNQQSTEKNLSQQDGKDEGTDPKSSNENLQSPSGQESKQVQDPGQVQQKEPQLQQGQDNPQNMSNYNSASLPPHSKSSQPFSQGMTQPFSQSSGQMPRPILPHVHQQSPYHQSPNRRQDGVMPPMAAVPRPRAPFHPPSYPHAANPGQRPPVDGTLVIPPYGNPRPGPYMDQKMALPGQGGHQPQMFMKDQPPHWRPSGPAGFPFESQSPSHAPSPIGGAQRSYPDHHNQSFMPPLTHMHGARPSSVEHSRHLMEQIAAFENETKGSKPTEGERFSGGRSEESFLIERGQQRSMFRPELCGRDRSPSKGAPDIYSRFPPGSSLDMPHRGPHHPSEMEFAGRPGIPPEIPAGREYLGRPGFPNDVPGGRDFPVEFGHSRKPDFASRAGALPDIGSRRTPPRPPYHLESDSRPKYPLDAEGPPFHIDGDSRSRFPEMDSRPSYLVDSDARPKFPDSEMSRPPFHLDAHPRSRFPAESERTGMHPDIEQRSKFGLDRERPRFDSDIDARRNFELRSGFPFEERSRATGFSSEIGRFAGPHPEIMGGRPDGLGLPSEFLGPRGDISRNRADTIPSIRSPGRDPAARRDSFSSGWREPFGAGHFDAVRGPGAMHGGPDLGRDGYRFEDPRMKGLDLHQNPLLHEPLNPGRPFHHVGRPHHPGGPGPGFAHGFGMPRPPIGFMNGGPFFQPDMDNDFGRKRKQSGSLGWCRICRVDCYTVQGLEEHSKSEEHQKKTLEMVMSIKQDTAKKHKNTNPPDHAKDSPISTSEKREKSAKSDEDEVAAKADAD